MLHRRKRGGFNDVDMISRTRGRWNCTFLGVSNIWGVRRQSASPRGVCVAYGKALLLAVSRAQSYGKIVTLRHPMVKPYPREVPTLAR